MQGKYKVKIGTGKGLGGADAQRGVRHGRAQEVKGKVKDRTKTTPLPLPERIPEERSDRSGATRSLVKRMVRGRGVIY